MYHINWNYRCFPSTTRHFFSSILPLITAVSKGIALVALYERQLTYIQLYAALPKIQKYQH